MVSFLTKLQAEISKNYFFTGHRRWILLIFGRVQNRLLIVDKNMFKVSVKNTKITTLAESQIDTKTRIYYQI